MNTYSEENYLKAIYKLSMEEKIWVSTNAIAGHMSTKASSVTDMVQKLADKKLVNYQRYQGVTLTADGERMAVSIIRKHRLWEQFLYQYLGFKWNEIHDIAEEMEHIKSDLLIERLDSFMNHPNIDPHGDPIPDNEGHFPIRNSLSLSKISVNEKCIVVGLKNKSNPFLTYLNKVGIQLDTEVEIIEWFDYDHSANLKINDKSVIHLSYSAIQNLLIIKKNEN